MQGLRKEHGKSLCDDRPVKRWLSGLIAALVLGDIARAQLHTDSTAPAEQRAVLLQTANGLPQIDITRPNTSGVSINRFSQFDITAQGAVINNGRSASATALAGWIAANPALLGGEAKLIINDVRSNHPSLLQGYVEIAGSKAELVIANPSGISCRGCGFIHASKAELATASPNLIDGKLSGYTMGEGTLEIAGRGLDASRTDILSLLTQAAQINAEIWAHDVRMELKAPEATKVATKAADNASDGSADKATNHTGIHAAGTPVFALDVAKLGGMYANRIWLVGTAHGLGMRNAGHWSATESLRVNIDGKLENSGSIDARSLTLTATRIDNVAHGKLLGERIALQAERIANTGHPDASPVIAATADIDIAVGELQNSERATIFAGADLRIGRQLGDEGDGHVRDSDHGRGNATGQAAHILNRAASIDALGRISLSADLLENLNGGVELTEVQVSGPQRFIYVQPAGDSRKYLPDELTAAGIGKTHTYSRTEYVVDRSVHESRVLNSAPASLVSGGDMQLTGQTILNENSQIIAGGELTGTLDRLQNIATQGTTRVHESGTSQTMIVLPIANIAYKEVRGPVLPYAPADTLSTQPLPLAVTRDKQADQLPSPAIDIDAQRIAADRSSLFRMNERTGPLLVTDPRFTQYRQWLSSNAMLARLTANPERLQQRLGDGYIEQRIVREQIAQLTGRRYLPGQDNDEAQYAALMANGMHQATALQLQPGIALTASQLAKLTADIVWLVEQDITVPARDEQPAHTKRVLVPRVYLLPRSDDLDASGTLISAQRVVLSVTDAIDNAGLIHGTEGLQLQARAISNRGILSGDNALLIATDDIDIHGGEVRTRHQQQLWAGRDIRVASSTRDSARHSASSRTTSDATRTGIDRVALLHVADQGELQMLAGRDIAVDGAHVMNHGSDTSVATTAKTAMTEMTATTAATASTVITAIAGRDLTLGTVTTRSGLTADARGSANYLHESQRTEVGTVVQADRAILMAAGRDLATRAANIDSTNAAVSLSAARDIAMTAAASTTSFAQGLAFRHRDLFSSSTSTQRTVFEHTNTLASTISGSTVDLLAGQDLNIVGSDVTSDRLTRLQATGDVLITSATESDFSASFRRDTRSGLFSGPGPSISIGNQRQQHTSELHSTRQRGSQIGTLAGNVRIDAGDSFRQQASKIVAPQGSVAITAANVDIAGAVDTSDARQTSSFRHSGVSISLSNPVIDAGRSLDSLNKASQQTQGSRAQVLAAAATGLTVANTANEVAGDPAHAGDVKLAVTIGSSRSESTATGYATRVVPSVVAAGSDVDIRAQGRPDARLTVAGSQIVATETVALQSDGELLMEAQASTRTQSMNSHSRSAGIGVAASIGKTGTGIGIIARAGKARGQTAAHDSSWTNTEVSAAGSASLQSQGDSQLKGAIVNAPIINARVGGNLLIESLQDSSHYEHRQRSLSGSFTLPLAGGSPSAQFNASTSNIHSDFLSTATASGLRAGDGGFQVQVAGETELKGGIIASTDAAVTAGVNHFSTGELALADVMNRADYSARAAGVGIGVGQNPQGSYAPQGSNAGRGSDSGHSVSVTTAGVSDLAGNKAVRTGDVSTGLARIFDAERVAREINAQVTIAQEFTGKAYKAVDDYVSQHRRALELAMKDLPEGDAKQALTSRLDQLRREEQVMNILIGSVVGMESNAVTKEGLSAAAEKMRELMVQESGEFVGITDGKTTISNLSGESQGVRNDRKKLGGTRIDLDLLCGKQNENCKVLSDEFDKPILDSKGKTQLVLDKHGFVQFDEEKAGTPLATYLESDKGKGMFGTTGGIQGYKGTLFGVPYKPGSWQDRLIESFSGVHDFIGGHTFNLYDASGNAKRGMSDHERTLQNVWSGIAVIPSAPFAVADMLSPQVWQAIAVFLSAAQ